MKIGFIGVGNMGGAILSGILKTGTLNAKDVIAYDHNKRGIETANAFNVHVAESIKEAVKFSDIIILAVKPKDSLAVIKEANKFLENKALLSIVAGLDYKTIHKALNGVKARVLVSLPNTPAMVGMGATGLTLETNFLKNEKHEAEKLFKAIGIVEWVNEKMLYAVSALSGSGPAFTAIFIEALADAAVLEGLPRSMAYKFAAQTVLGTGKLCLETGLHPGILKDNVCSPGGTTIEGVKELEKGAFRYTTINAVGKTAKKFFSLIK
jgi:pyrroline-5-carboxylate reductase